MTDNEVIRAVRDVLLAGFSAAGVPCQVKQAYQPTPQGTVSGNVLYLAKILPGRYGHPGTKRIYNNATGVFDTSTVFIEVPTYQVTGSVDIDPSDISHRTVSDLVNMAANILQTLATRKTLLESGIGIERITQVRLLYFNNQEGRHEQEPSFDFTLNYTTELLSETPAVTATDVDIISI